MGNHGVSNGRIIAIQHRVKMTVSGEARPTILGITDEKGYREVELATEQDELDWMLSRGKLASIGYRKGDRITTILGGSGDAFVYALSRYGEEVGARVYRVPSYRVKDLRDQCLQGDREVPTGFFKEGGETSDAWLLSRLLEDSPEYFYVCGPRDREQILVGIKRRQHRDAQQERIKAGQRLRARAIGQIFYGAEGKYPEGAIEDAVKRLEADDPIYQGLCAEESKRQKELERAFKASWLKPLLGSITGVGPSIAGDIIAVIGDIRRFETAAKLKAYAGVHVLGADGEKMPKGTDPRTAGGKFARRRTGQRSNWNPQLKQALFQFGTQLVYRPQSVWGKKLLEVKADERAKHPHTELVVKDKSGAVLAIHPLIEGAYERKGKKYTILLSSGELVEVVGTQRYFDGHIHKRAVWKTLSLFVEWLHAEWTRYDKEVRGELKDESKAA